MLVDFTMRNFRSFREDTNLSLLAEKSVKEHEETTDATNVIAVQGKDLRLLKAAVIYGANGSGKSNLIEGMSFFKKMILKSFSDDNILKRFNQLKFQFDILVKDTPSFFEIVFIMNENWYRYGFEIADDTISLEWLFVKSSESNRESYCFKRNGQKIKINSKTYKGASGLDAKTRNNSLFLSTCAQFNISLAILIKKWFLTEFNIISGANILPPMMTIDMLQADQLGHKRITDFIKLIDLDINDITIEEGDVEEIPKHLEKLIGKISDNPEVIKLAIKDAKKLEIFADHNRYKGKELKGNVRLPFTLESLGTQKIFSLLGPWFDTILRGGVLVIDEFGSSMHTSLTLEMLKIFQSTINKTAQLIITTHDTNLLRKDILRRDQIWFVEKDKYGGTDLYSLIEYRPGKVSGVRNDASFQKDYLLGKYGAIPYFGNVSKFLEDFSGNVKKE